MRNIGNQTLLALGLFGLLFSSCYETRNLPQDEMLYTGISDIAYGHLSTKKPKKGKSDGQTEKEGVITAINDAYTNVEELLTGSGSLKTKREQPRELAPQQQDSLRAEQTLEKEALSQVSEEAEAVLGIAPNNSFFGSSRMRFPLPVGLWTYNRFAGSQSRFGKWMFNTFGAEPKYITTVNPRMRAQVAQNVLHNYGYFGGQVLYEVQPQSNSRKAKVAYSVLPGRLYRFDSIAYQQFPASADSLIQKNMRRTQLKTGKPFTTLSLDAERNRLAQVFRNNGYYYCQPEYFTYRADTLQRKGWVQLQVRPSVNLPAEAGRRFHLRNTLIYLTDVQGEVGVYNDSVGSPDVRMMFFDGKRSAGEPSTYDRNLELARGGQRKGFLKPHSPLRYTVLRCLIFYNKGNLYRQDLQDFIQEKVTSLGIFSGVSTDYVRTDTTATCDSLDVIMHLTLDKPYDAEFKANATTKSNGYVGPGVSFSMTKRNAFRGAESLSFSAFGSYEWLTGANNKGKHSVLNSYEYGTSLSLDYPYIRLFGLGRRFLRHSLSTTSFKVEAKWLNRAAYFGRVSVGARVDYSLKRTFQDRHELTLFRLDYDVQLHATRAFDSIMSVNKALAVSMRNQFVPSMQYTYTRTSPRGARNPRTLIVSLKEAGNVTSGIYAAFGRSWKEKDKNLFGVPFAQYLKATVEFTDRIKLFDTRTYLAGRVMAGAVVSYGNATIAPYADLFSIGGANSLRAFTLRSIGPGSYNPSHSGYSYIDQMGDLKFEANLEYRFPLVSSLYGAVFLDAGNVWLMRNNENHPGGAFRLRNLGKELALGTGLGLRYDLDFIVVRFDVGVGLHAPYDTGKFGYYNMTSFGKSLGYHFAIGYPF